MTALQGRDEKLFDTGQARRAYWVLYLCRQTVGEHEAGTDKEEQWQPPDG